MEHKIIKVESIKEWGRARELLIKYSAEESGNADAKRQRFLSILNSRYGHTTTKAVDELELNNPMPSIIC
jgi:hypothetical protein